MDATAEWAWCDTVAHDVGDAFYVYDEFALLQALAVIEDAFAELVPRARFHYAYKANYSPFLCAAVRQAGWSAEVDSAMLLWLARQAGVAPSDIVCNGIARDRSFIREALISGALVNLDADRDLREALLVAGEGHPIRTAVRLNMPTPTYPAPRLGRTRAEAVAMVQRLLGEPGVDVLGLMSHVPDASPEGIRVRIRDLVAASADAFPEGPRIIGMGGSLAQRHEPLALGAARVAQVVAEELGRVPWGSDIDVIVEPGANVAAPSMDLVARVVDVRVQPGRTVVNVAGSILQTSPNTRRVDFPVRVIPAPRVSGPRVSGTEVALVGGHTAIDGDWLCVDLPADTQIHEGDFLVFAEVGAYSVSMGTHFTDPCLAIVERQGDVWKVLRRRPTFAETLAGFTQADS